MSDIGKEQVKYLSELSRLGLNDAEVEQFTPELEEIMKLVEQLQKAPTQDVLPTNQVTGLSDIWREDEVKPSPITQAELLKNAPATEDGYIKVNRVLE